MQPAQDIPHLRKTVNSHQLIVKGKPFLCLGGELHNSSMSNAEFMRGVWPNMKAMNVNALLGGVHWEMIEPTEGNFDFSELDQMILDARGHGLHLVLLWFGSFKNARSTYVPAWVKKDHKRFPRIHAEVDRKKETLELLSPFHSRSWEADAKAFATLMRHIREFDGDHSTVIMVQVENETGLLGDSRDRSPLANKLFSEPIPEDLLNHLKSSAGHPRFQKRFPGFSNVSAGATWEQAFGKGLGAEEAFMAHGFSNYIGQVAAAGKAEYPIPFYTNTWISFDEPSTLDLSASLGPHRSLVAAGGVKPGMYPSGGPYPQVMDIWKFNAPALDFLSPDVYFHNYEWVCQQYRYQNQPLFIPEQKRDEAGARRVFLAFGTYGAMGCSPFGIDTLEAATSPMTRVYGLLQSMSKYILDAQANRPDDITGFFFDEHKDEEDEPEKWVKVFGDFELTIVRSFVFGKPGPGCGIIIHQGDGKFLLLGWGYQVIFRSTNPKSTFAGILNCAEKIVDGDGNLTTGRVMNGDETRHGEFYIMPNEDPDYGGFPIAVTIPAKTAIAEVVAYSLEEDEDEL
ncbi:uncharacterized protein NECHADRAFT_43143 [Fusarium vanettenii 77-13-4]|uniref:Glycoside hydrolase family 35 n=1 Tax=Fusarium vanettenii (strain ATCC MYA-4622 / CBS 123669 / FGSC 9596 / NRRL 45880 / 77-13-4) TaxID=660122 RepID=C7ZAP0_FUSV7|nr:uncharacterized protein NECHADRAFT_43143 [Fusarium vanettenii 77-13-4]EEU39306.1 hypothetical protein NECHADRAFT_43143 [Fusarium vanettenii 77-13-4]